MLEKRDQMFLQLTYKAYTVFYFSVPLSYIIGQGAVGGNVPRSMHRLLCTCVFSMLRMVCSCKAGAQNTILCRCAPVDESLLRAAFKVDVERIRVAEEGLRRLS